MGWRIVEVNTDEYMQLHFNNLLIKRQGEKILLNIADIDTLIVNNDRASISVKLLNALTNANVSVIFMNSAHEPTTFSIPVSGHHNSLKILARQLEWKPIYKGRAWMEIIQNKITAQMHLCKRLGLPEDDFGELITSTKHYDVTNREGHAAKIYWHRLFSLNFQRDQNAIENPTINAMLNYGYAIVRSAMIKSIIAKGLDARISLFHKSFTNFFALASDLMEPFRPLVDEIVYRHRAATMFGYEIRDELIGVLERQVKVNATKFYLNMAMDKTVDHLIAGNGWLWVDLWD